MPFLLLAPLYALGVCSMVRLPLIRLHELQSMIGPAPALGANVVYFERPTGKLRPASHGAADLLYGTVKSLPLAVPLGPIFISDFAHPNRVRTGNHQTCPVSAHT